MQANLLRVTGTRCAVVHFPGPGSVVRLYFSSPIPDYHKALCVTPSDPVKCVVSPGDFRGDGFYDSTMEVQWESRKRARPSYKQIAKM